MKFQKGQSGNPAGKPKGAVNQSTRVKESFKKHVGQDAEEFFMTNFIDRITEGDTSCLRLLGEWLHGKPLQTAENTNINQNTEMSAEEASEKLSTLGKDGLIKLITGSDSSTDDDMEKPSKKQSA